MRAVFLFLVVSVLSTGANALTLKSGEVLGGDGKVYQGASPETEAAMLKQAGKTDWFGNSKTSGVMGSNLFIVVEDKVTYIPLTELQGKSKDAIKEHVLDSVKASFGVDIDINDAADAEQLERHVESLQQNAEFAAAAEELDQAIEEAAGNISEEQIQAAVEAGVLVVVDDGWEEMMESMTLEEQNAFCANNDRC